MIEEFLEDAGQRMDQAVEHVQGEFATIRTGRANPGILHRVMVDYYGTPTPLQQLASFSVPEPRLLVVSPYDKSSIGNIEKGINASGLGLNPSSDGNVIRLAFPPLTEERSRELIRVVRHMAEEGRVAVRNIRRDANDELRHAEKDGDLPQDDSKRAQDHIQEMTDKHIELVNEVVEAKEKEIMEV